MQFKTSLSLFALVASMLACSSVSAENSNVPLQAPLFDNMGTFHRKVSTQNPLAQRFFDQGLAFFYGFEWGESVRSFREATRLDPHCGMCYWGLALASGYKGNAPMTGHEYSDAKTAIEKALILTAEETPNEIALVKALSLRFQHAPKPAVKAGAFSCHANGGESASPAEILNYANKMKGITKKFPHDNDAKAIYAYALFDLIQWKFWDDNGKINSHTPTLIKTLQSILDNDKLHVGANHYYVHVMEQSPHPEAANTNAENLKKLIPRSEHLVHMPAHIYFLTGRYHAGTEANLASVAVYKSYSQTCHAQGFKPEITYLYQHDFDFLRTTANMEGRHAVALQAAQELIENLPAATIEADPALQWFIPIPSYVQARFGFWHEILALPMPNIKYRYAIGMWHYVRGMAFAHIGDMKSSSQESAALRQIIHVGTHPNSLGKSGLNLLKIANEVLTATLANLHGDETATLAHLKKASQIQHDMGYHEPPDWYFPMKEIEADAYLKWQHPKAAIQLYNEDLKQYPNNGWALYGLAAAWRQLGDNEKADHFAQAFKEAWKYADIPTPISLF
jgi:tetratricopeptide (TPR) repeat protein